MSDLRMPGAGEAVSQAADRPHWLWAGGMVFDVILGGEHTGGSLALLDQRARQGDASRCMSIVGIEMILKSGRMDAEYSARILDSVDPMEVKHTVEDEHAEERTYPAYLSLAEQWERQVQAIQRLRVGEAFVRLADDSVHSSKPAPCHWPE